MRRIKLALLITALLSSLSHGAPEETPTNLYILMNGRGGDIKAFKSVYPNHVECLDALKTVQKGGHTKAIMFCGTELLNAGVYTKPRNSAIITK